MDEIRSLIKQDSERAIKSFASSNRWSNLDIETEVWIPEPWIESNPCKGDITVHRGSSLKPWGRVSYEIRCTSPEWETRGRSTTKVSTNVAVSKNLLRRGHTITAKDIEIRKMELDRSYLKIFPLEKALVGKRVRRSIRPGEIIDPRQVDKAYLVTEGKPVTIEVNQYGIQASMPGIAVEDGALRETVRVRNRSTGREVPGIVVGPNKVSVSF